MIGYKLARPDGFDFYTGRTIQYRAETYPHEVVVPGADAAKGICSSGVGHASENPNDCFVGARIPCSAYRLEFEAVCGDAKKWGWLRATVKEEITDLDTLLGWRYSEATTPVNPFSLPLVSIPNRSDRAALRKWASLRASLGASVRASLGASLGASVRASLGAALRKWDSVGDSVGASVGASVRASVRASVGAFVGDIVGDIVGEIVWASVWDSVWDSVGNSVGDIVWDSVGNSVGDSVRESVWAYTGSLFPGIAQWRYAPPGVRGYPYQSAVTLWQRGLVPSYDGTVWRLHSGPKAAVVWQGTP